MECQSAFGKSIGRISPIGPIRLSDFLGWHPVSPKLLCEVYDHRKIRLCGVAARKHAGRSHPSQGSEGQQPQEHFVLYPHKSNDGCDRRKWIR